MRKVQYGALDGQEGDLHLPMAGRPPVVCLLHGGFWRMPFNRGEMTPIAQDLAVRGMAVWNMEYRRLGTYGGGWPGTLQDVAAGIHHLASLADDGVELDLSRVAVVGHSAGGHLALWSATRGKAGAIGISAPRVRATGVVGLAPVADLAGAQALHAGHSAVAEFLDGEPEERPERYQVASPLAMLPLGIAQLLIHGVNDEVLPIQLSRGYAQAAQTAGDNIRFVALPGAGHMDFLDPASLAHESLCDWLCEHFGLTRQSQ